MLKMEENTSINRTIICPRSEKSGMYSIVTGLLDFTIPIVAKLIIL